MQETLFLTRYTCVFIKHFTKRKRSYGTNVIFKIQLRLAINILKIIHKLV